MLRPDTARAHGLAGHCGARQRSDGSLTATERIRAQRRTGAGDNVQELGRLATQAKPRERPAVESAGATYTEHQLDNYVLNMCQRFE